MNSRVIGKIEYDSTLLAGEVSRILGFPDILHSYTEFCFGQFSQHVLWNETGSHDDTIFHEINSPAIPTAYGRQLPYLEQILESTFAPGSIQMVRANLMHSSILIPHRDYTELSSGYSRFARIHLPVHTHHSCRHSEDDVVFHMAKGEIWVLDTGKVHAAYCPTEFPRISICVDVKTERRPLESLFSNKNVLNSGLTPTTFSRPPLDPDYRKRIDSFIGMMNRYNFANVIDFLSRIHFYKDVPAFAMYEWLREGLAQHPDPALLQKVNKMIDFYVVHREMNERFSFWEFGRDPAVLPQSAKLIHN